MNKNKIIAQRYKILSGIGDGGMADVYLAQDLILHRQVAIKVLRGELSKDPVALVRFQREASAVTKLSHPNVVIVFDVGKSEGMNYIVMEYVKGKTLKQLIAQQGALYIKEALDIMIQLTKAVQHAHEHEIIHRDIKPQNVLIKDDGTVKITDFGIALLSDAIALTPNESVLGSAHYLAPEATKGEEISPLVDIYALGIVFYELLRGSVPFKGDNPVAIAVKHLHDEIPSIREFNPSLPQSVENIIIRATSKKTSTRYQSAKEMLYDLEHCLDADRANEEKLVLNNNVVKIRDVEIHDEDDKDEIKNKSNHIWIAMAVLIICIIIAVVVIVLFLPSNKIVPKVEALKQEEAMNRLHEAGFNEKNIRIVEAYSDNLDAGYVMSSDVKEGSEVASDTIITLTISQGKYFVIEDYRNSRLENVVRMLEESAPNINVEVEYLETTNMKPGYIYEQDGLDIGSKIAPNQNVTILFTVTAPVEFEIKGFIGLDINEAKQILEAKGILPVLHQLDKSEIEEGEVVEEGVVVDIDPKEGSWYRQEGDNTITLYYY